MNKRFLNTLLILTLMMLSLVMSACGLTIAPEEDQVATVVAATIEAGQNATAVVQQVSTEVAATLESQNTTRVAEEEAMLTATAVAISPTATPTPTSTPTPVNEILATETPPPATDPPPNPTNPPPPPPNTPIPTNTPLPTSTPLPTNTPTLIPRQPVEETFYVAESDSNVETTLYVHTGDLVTFSATGEIWSGVLFTGTNGPNGWDYTDCDPKFPLPCAHPFSLLAKTDGGNWFEVGQSYQYTYQGNGIKEILLRINDDAPGNGTGGFNVTVQITPQD